MKLAPELSAEIIAELIYLECLRKHVTMNANEDELEKIFLASAEQILMEGPAKNLQDIVSRITDYVIETKFNYPDYFVTGEC